MQPQHKPTHKPRALGPKQLAWCDQHLGIFESCRKGVEQVMADTEASRRAHPMPEVSA